MTLKAKTSAGRSGFKLLELVVVVAITGILIGLVLTGLMMCRAAADRASCQNNLHNFGVASTNYHDACGGYPVFDWPQALLPFMDVPGAKDPEAAPAACPKSFICPADRAGQQSGQPLGSYGFNSRLMGLAVTDITDGPSNTILMAEAEAARLKAPVNLGSELAGLDLSHTAHAGGGNVLFADGSVRFLWAEKYPPDVLTSLLTPNGGEMPPGD